MKQEYMFLKNKNLSTQKYGTGLIVVLSVIFTRTFPLSQHTSHSILKTVDKVLTDVADKTCVKL